MGKSAAARHLMGTEELLSAMSNEEVEPETTRPRKARWQQVFMACCCVLALAAAGKGFLYLDTEISTVESAVESAVKDLGTLKTQLTSTDTKEQLAAVTAEVDSLKATNAQLRAEVEQIREAFQTLKASKNNVVPAQRKRR